MSMSGDNSTVEYPLFQTECGGAIPTSPLQLHIYEVDYKKAIFLNEEWHSRLPIIRQPTLATNACYVAAFENQYYAVGIWSNPIAANRLKDGERMFELRRFAISAKAPRNTATRMLRIMRLLVSKKFPHVQRLISYQDTAAHTGTIYRADNWTPVSTNQFVSWTVSNHKRKSKRSADQAVGAKVRWEYEVKR